MLTLNLNLGDLGSLALELKAKADALVAQAVHDLGVQVHARIVEEAQARLKTSRELFLNALSLEHDDNAAIITLDKSAVWIDEGMTPHSMVEDLIWGGGRPRMNKKDGSYYKIIPFIINKGPSQLNSSGMAIRAAAMSAMRKAKIPWGKIETNDDGTPKVGTLHRLDVMGAPIKTEEGVGQGHGPIGAVRQGATGIPFLKGLNVMQRQIGTSPTVIGRQAMVFRIVSSKHAGGPRWRHPGTEGKKILDSAYEWAKQEWETKIMPEILAELQR